MSETVEPFPAAARTARSRHVRRAFLLADAIMGLMLIGLAGTLLVVAVSRHTRAIHDLSNTRAAGRLAEETLLDMQAGLPPPKTVADERVTIEPCPGRAPSGFRWVRAAATVRGQSRLLVGLVPDRASLPQTPEGGRE